MSRGVEQLPRVEVERAPGTESGFADADAFCERVARSSLFAVRRARRRGPRSGPSRRPRRHRRLLRLARARAAAGRGGARRGPAPAGRPRRRRERRPAASRSPSTIFSTRRSTPSRVASPVGDAWAAYVLGPIALLAREEEARLPRAAAAHLVRRPGRQGRRLLGGGRGRGPAGRRRLPRRLARAAPARPPRAAGRAAASRGAPCGAMDQMAAACGERGAAARSCSVAPPRSSDSIPLPPPLAVWGIDSGVRSRGRRQSATGAHGAPRSWGRRCSAAATSTSRRSTRRRCDPGRLPEQLSGKEFLSLGRRVDDPVQRGRAEVVYPVRAATLYPLEEQVRVRQVRGAPRPADHCGPCATTRRADGRVARGLLACGLGTARTDALVDRPSGAGWARVSREHGSAEAAAAAPWSSWDGRTPSRSSGRSADELGAGSMGGSSAGAAGFGVRMPGERTLRPDDRRAPSSRPPAST